LAIGIVFENSVSK